MKILIVAMSDSIHTARWIRQLEGMGWEIHLFPSIDYGDVHSELENVTVHHMFYSDHNPSQKVIQKGFNLKSKLAVSVLRYIFQKKFPFYRQRQLKNLIKKLNPSVVHSLEIQHAGYLVHEVKKKLDSFPPWILTNWGSDIYLFGRLQEHRQKIAEVLSASDYYSCECSRDVVLAKELGFKGIVLPVVPNSGGMEEYVFEIYKNTQKPSLRKKIMLKGYQGWSGRALTAIRAMSRCADILIGYEIIAYSVAEEVKIALELFSSESGIPIRILSSKTARKELLAAHSEARISVGLGISDGISTSMLEAMSVGTFVIQARTACANEWIIDYTNGLLVHPEEPQEVEAALRMALLDDSLVDQAAKINSEIIEKRVDFKTIATTAKSFYELAARKD
jgi:glycosyltransferase involved in cell wall biosynthesis